MQNEIMNRTWSGYLRKNGLKGIRNRVLVLYTVKCAEFVAQRIVAQCSHNDVELVGFDGCTDNQYAVDLLISLIRHPNVGAVLAVGLGCEYVQPERLADIAKQEGKYAEWMFIQNEGGTRPSVEKGTAWVQKTLRALQDTPRAEMSMADLIIGAESGGWVKRYHDYLTQQNAKRSSSMAAYTGEQVKGTAWSHPLEDYTGSYLHDGYMPVKVCVKDNKLFMTLNGIETELTHFHYDTFVTNDIMGGGEIPPGLPVSASAS